MQFQKISILPLQKELKFPGGEGFCKTKIFKKRYMYVYSFFNITRISKRVGKRVLEKIPFHGRGKDSF